MLLLAFVALKQGDLVGVQAFGASRKTVAPQRGMGAVNTLLNEVYDLHTSTDASDYVTAAEDLMRTQQKRSLVVLMTSLRETDMDLLTAVRLLTRRHVVLLASLRESVLDTTAAREPADFADALRIAGTYRYLAERQELHQACAPLVHLLIDCVPEQLPVRIVNAYWQIKRSGDL